MHHVGACMYLTLQVTLLHVTHCRAPHGVVLGPPAGFPDVRAGRSCWAPSHAGSQLAGN